MLFQAFFANENPPPESATLSGNAIMIFMLLLAGQTVSVIYFAYSFKGVQSGHVLKGKLFIRQGMSSLYIGMTKLFSMIKLKLKSCTKQN